MVIEVTEKAGTEQQTDCANTGVRRISLCNNKASNELYWDTILWNI